MGKERSSSTNAVYLKRRHIDNQQKKGGGEGEKEMTAPIHRGGGGEERQTCRTSLQKKASTNTNYKSKSRGFIPHNGHWPRRQAG